MILVSNWKAYVENRDIAKTLFAVAKRASQITKHQIILAPPAPILGALASRNKSAVSFAAQDISHTTGGARTGEITAEAFSAAGAEYAIVGHSERRAAGDTNPIIAEKLRRACAHGLSPILCVGENERDEEGKYLTLLREDLTKAVESLETKERANIIVAYEPAWAIGQTAEMTIDPGDLTEMVLYIRKVLAEILPGGNADKVRILYGGAVDVSDIRGLAAQTGVDGFLVGRASVDPRGFMNLVKQIS